MPQTYDDQAAKRWGVAVSHMVRALLILDLFRLDIATPQSTKLPKKDTGPKIKAKKLCIFSQSLLTIGCGGIKLDFWL